MLAQRNAALANGRQELPAWNERFVELGARLRARRAAYVDRLRRAMDARPGFRPAGESYELRLPVELATTSEEAHRETLTRAVEGARLREAHAGRSLVGPHRDPVAPTLTVHREETGQSAVALLDDLDSELDEERADHLCSEVAARGQALVTTAHPAWAGRLSHRGRVFEVSGGEVRCA